MTYQDLNQEQKDQVQEYMNSNLQAYRSHHLEEIIEASYLRGFELTAIDSDTAGEDDLVMTDIGTAQDAMARYLSVDIDELKTWDKWSWQDYTEQFISLREEAINQL